MELIHLFVWEICFSKDEFCLTSPYFKNNKIGHLSVQCQTTNMTIVEVGKKSLILFLVLLSFCYMKEGTLSWLRTEPRCDLRFLLFSIVLPTLHPQPLFLLWCNNLELPLPLLLREDGHYPHSVKRSLVRKTRTEVELSVNQHCFLARDSLCDVMWCGANIRNMQKYLQYSRNIPIHIGKSFTATFHHAFCSPALYAVNYVNTSLPFIQMSAMNLLCLAATLFFFVSSICTCLHAQVTYPDEVSHQQHADNRKKTNAALKCKWTACVEQANRQINNWIHLKKEGKLPSMLWA